MFHTFAVCSSKRQDEPKQCIWPEESGVFETRRACEECRRRKIRCDREQPCGACVYYKKSRLCQFEKKRLGPRKLSEVSLQYRAVLRRLFPSINLESLFSLSREQLINLVLHEHSSPVSSPSSPSSQHSPEIVPPLQETPVYNEPCREKSFIQGLESSPDPTNSSQTLEQAALQDEISDDVNSLSPAKHTSCYLGISSIHAVMKVILSIDPGSLPYLAGSTDTETECVGETQDTRSLDVHNPPFASQHPYLPNSDIGGLLTIGQDNGFSFGAELQLIDAFFLHVHPLITIIDEMDFRAIHQAGTRQDGHWKALLNMVLALGSISISPVGNKNHKAYFQRARAFISLDYFAHPCIEAVQTLGLMGGFYLHLTSQPHLAYSLMGVAMRMAAALGLHREPAGLSVTSGNLRRRVWWSLFCMDTFSSITLGRPTFGRCGPSINITQPELCNNDVSLSDLTLIHNTRFCLIATEIQEALATSPMISHEQVTELDEKLVNWYKDLPTLLKDVQEDHIASSIYTIQTNTQWRYLNSRMLLYRPALLNYAMRRTHFRDLLPEERHAILKCHLIASETISNIATADLRDPTAAGGGVWYIFQAVLVPLLLLFIHGDKLQLDPMWKITSQISYRKDVNITIKTLAQLGDRTPIARRTLAVVTRMFNASQRRREPSQPSLSQGSLHEPRDAHSGNGTSCHDGFGDDSASQEPCLAPLVDGTNNDHDTTGMAESSPSTAVDGTYPFVDSCPSFFNPFSDQQMWDFLAWTGEDHSAVEQFDSQFLVDPSSLWTNLAHAQLPPQ